MQQLSANGRIEFYHRTTNPDTAWLGNLHPCPMTYKGVSYQCSEAAFQAQKFIHHPHIMKQFENCNGGDAFRLANDPNNQAFVRPDWKQVNVSEMYHILNEKINMSFLVG